MEINMIREDKDEKKPKIFSPLNLNFNPHESHGRGSMKIPRNPPKS